ncbi:DUF3298 domain-containing protein [Romboutsia hominis]|uniref:DUF3298 domain-containing protein n=1 Tax=Romboutsia faecis TaxID=2764597 RepID=A0ABR7JMP3_9FIRM|nr:DUF3298 and DUF4163 domain-containing protein [Romboutsia faecis]MBC5995871.1 DUF3298 domain-containing protein [Romboutsia faecis]
MLIIENGIIEKEEKSVRYVLNYPIIKLLNKENNFMNFINKRIYEDVLCFKEVVQQILSEDESNILTNLLTEYTVTFNENNIISIPIEFNQFIGLYNISYINSYNYDFNLEKEIKLKDIFDKVIDYKKFLTNTIRLQLSGRLEYCEKEIEDELINIIHSIEIYEDQPFYLESDGLVICFSSYEMGNSITNILEFKIMYEDAIDYFSEYFISEVLF